ncbi:MAG: VWA domain-containing protein [Bacteroidetes bacterium]|nr:VWA domain-containing protein [Bacteroidota bacterium]
MENAIDKLEQEYERFIEFAPVLDRSTRRYFVAYLQHLLQGKELEQELQSDYFNYFKDALADLFDDEDLKRISQEHALLGSQVLVDTLHWFRKTYGKLAQKHPYEEEQRELESWGVRHLRQFSRSWTFLIRKVQDFYSKEEIDPSFHEGKFKTLIAQKDYQQLSEKDRLAIERVYKDLLAQWDARLQSKILSFQMTKLKDEKESYKEKLEAKVQEFQKLSSLVKPFTEHISKYWDMSRALWQDATLNLVERYDALLKEEDELKRLADLLGQLRKAEIETEEATYEKTVNYKEWVKDPLLKTEIVGVQSGNDLNYILPSEVALFGDKTEWQFLKRFADENLQINKFEDRQLVNSNKVYSETYQRVKKKEKGPFIICVDTSGSMEGEPERIAKVLCFGILKMAAADQRRAFLINFSSGIQTIDLLNLVDSIDDVAAFLQKSFHGGTDISLALSEALKQLDTHNYRDADVLVISDFIMYRISDDLSQAMEKQQHNYGTQFHSLIITDQANEEVIEAFDNVWSYNPDQKGIVKELHRNLEDIRKRQL